VGTLGRALSSTPSWPGPSRDAHGGDRRSSRSSMALSHTAIVLVVIVLVFHLDMGAGSQLRLRHRRPDGG
jgi:hypothetical protein